jgi:hypothetical protein
LYRARISTLEEELAHTKEEKTDLTFDVKRLQQEK